MWTANRQKGTDWDLSILWLSLKILLRIFTRYSGQPFPELNFARLLGATHHKMHMSKNATHEKSFSAFLFSNKLVTSKSVAASVDFPAKNMLFHWTNHVQQLWLWAWPKLSIQITWTEHANRPETADLIVNSMFDFFKISTAATFHLRGK